MTNPAYEATNSDVEKLIALIKASREEDSIPILLGHQFDQLIAELGRAHRRNGQLKAERDALRESGLNGQANTRAAADIYFQLIEECDIPPGGSLVQHIDGMRDRIAELESQPLCVKLPEAYTIRPGHPINEGERGVMIPKEGGNWFSRFDVEHAIRVAGGTVEGSD